MLHIILLILKIIGIVLAILLGIILLGIVCVLFVPVRYRLTADGKLGEEEPVRLNAKVHWLFHLINVTFSYSQSACLKIRLLCFTIYDSTKTRKRKKNSAKEDVSDKNESTQKAGVLEEKDGQNAVDASVEGMQQEAGNVDNAVTDGPEHNPEQGLEYKQEQLQVQQDCGEEDNRFVKKIKKIMSAIITLIHRIWNAIKNIEYTIRKICDKIREIIENIRYYTEVLKSDVFQSSWAVCRKQILKILRMLKPQKCRINVRVGTGDPAGTGQLMAVYGILYPVIGNHVFVEADFEQRIIEGDLYIKGRIRGIVFIVVAFKLFFNKDIRHLIKLLKREECVDGR